MRKFVFALILAFIMIAAVGCGEADIGKVTSEPESTTAVAPVATPTPAPKQPEIFAIGDSVKFNDMVITLNGVRTSSGSDFEKPEKGKYVILDLTIENKGTESATISTMMNMSLYDADSYKYNVALFTDLKGSLDGEIAAGRKIRGEVAFDVPDSAYYEFAYEELLSTGQAIWKFSLDK